MYVCIYLSIYLSIYLYIYVHTCTYTYIYIYTWPWQYDMILGSDALKGRVREALVRTLLAEQGTDMDVGMAAPSGDAGLEQKVGEDAQKPKEEPASERAQAEAGSAGEVSARVSDTWQRALDGVLQEIEELVADDELGNDVVMANSLGDDLVKDDGMDSAVAGLEPAAASDPAAAAPGAQLSEAAALRQDGGQGLGREDAGERVGAQKQQQDELAQPWVRRPHSVATLMVALAQPTTPAARTLLEKLTMTEVSQSVEDAAECLEEVL